MPRALGRLGLAEAECERHIALDIGIAGLGRLLADALDAMLIQQNYSRLVIDCNRPPGSTDVDPGRERADAGPGQCGFKRSAARRRAPARFSGPTMTASKPSSIAGGKPAARRC